MQDFRPVHHAQALAPFASTAAFQQCLSPACGATFGIDEVLVGCPRCGELLDVAYDYAALWFAAVFAAEVVVYVAPLLPPPPDPAPE